MCLTTRELSGANSGPLAAAGVPTWKSYLSVLLCSSLAHYSIFCMLVNPLNRPLSAFKLLSGDSDTMILGPHSPYDIRKPDGVKGSPSKLLKLALGCHFGYGMSKSLLPAPFRGV